MAPDIVYPHGESLGDSFRSGFRRHAAGVCLVTGLTPTGPIGMTVSSVASVSTAPPMLSFSLARSGPSGAKLVGSDRLSVTFLGQDDVEVATAFARHGGERFTPSQGWAEDATGFPVLKTAPATMWVRPARVVPAGNSWLLLAEVTDVEFGPRCAPLVYHDRSYRLPVDLAIHDRGGTR